MKLIKYPSAWIPIALSLTFLAIMFISFAISGVPAREADEGIGAHLFQIWLALEFFMIGFFAIKHFPQQSKQALLIIIFQILAVILTCAPVFLLKL